MNLFKTPTTLVFGLTCAALSMAACSSTNHRSRAANSDQSIDRMHNDNADLGNGRTQVGTLPRDGGTVTIPNRDLQDDRSQRAEVVRRPAVVAGPLAPTLPNVEREYISVNDPDRPAKVDKRLTPQASGITRDTAPFPLDNGTTEAERRANARRARDSDTTSGTTHSYDSN